MKLPEGTPGAVSGHAVGHTKQGVERYRKLPPVGRSEKIFQQGVESEAGNN